MMATMTLRAHPLDAILAEVIRDEGGDYPAAEAREEIAAAIAGIRPVKAAGGAPPGFCFISPSGGVAVFAIVGKSVDIYVVRCPKGDQWDLLNRFERYARSDVEAYRRVLLAKYGKDQPDLVVEPAMAVDWLFGGDEPESERDEEREVRAAGAAWELQTSPGEAALEPADSAGFDEPPDPMLEEMMNAIRAAGGGQGRKPFKPTDLG
jgi:hypothetical protein